MVAGRPGIRAPSRYPEDVLLLLALACGTPPIDTGPFDEDADGYFGAEDCDDTNPAVNPSVLEQCDGLDNDCDNSVDEGHNTVWYQDADGDGWGADGTGIESCSRPAGYVDRAGDCDDTSASYHPNAREDDCEDARDYNCDGSVGYDDEDGDGFAACADCDDGDAGRYPDADELCDDIDQDCDDSVDEDPADAGTWWYDADGDGYGGPLEQVWCEAPSGFVDTPGDCDDVDRDHFPGADELCDGDDDDCDGDVDESGALDVLTWYADDDEDGFGDAASAQAACSAPEGFVADDTDCDDEDSSAYPDADEYCDGVDHDCDTLVNEDSSVDVETFYADDDEDGAGDASDSLQACFAPSGYVDDASDCDDDDPDRAEFCCSLGTDGDLTVTADTTLAAGTYSYDRVSVAAGVTLTISGSGTTVLNANAVKVAGGILLSGDGRSAVSGGGGGGSPGDCSTAGDDGDSPDGASSAARGGDGEEGGGGGGSSSDGGDGDNATGSGGPSFGDAAMTTFTGGGGGAAGGGDGGDGGGGGGALAIIASEIRVSGYILADGADGGDAGFTCVSGGGGGGAGGMVWLHGDVVDVTGSISAQGGRGGSGDASGGGGSDGRVQVSGPSTSVTGAVTPTAYSVTDDPECEDG